MLTRVSATLCMTELVKRDGGIAAAMDCLNIVEYLAMMGIGDSPAAVSAQTTLIKLCQVCPMVVVMMWLCVI